MVTLIVNIFTGNKLNQSIKLLIDKQNKCLKLSMVQICKDVYSYKLK